MASFVPIPKDIGGIKTKAIGGLTKRQAIGFVSALILAGPIFYFVLQLAGANAAVTVAFFVAAPIMFCTMYEKEKMPFEVWMMGVLRQSSRDKIRRRQAISLKPGAIEQRRKIYKEEDKRNAAEDAKKTELIKGKVGLVKNKKENLFAILIEIVSKWYNKQFKKIEKKITAQDTLGFKKLYKCGTMRLGGGEYSATIRFSDLNYHLAHVEEKQAIFSSYCSVLNSFDDIVKIQLSIVNETYAKEDISDLINVKYLKDGLDHLRKEYRKMLRDQYEKGSKGITKSKYMTFTIKANSYKEAKARLYRIASDTCNMFTMMQVKSYPLGGEERIRVLRNAACGDIDKDSFEWLEKYQIRASDVISPKYIDTTNPGHLRTPESYIKTFSLTIEASDLSDEFLKQITDIESKLSVNIHIEPMDHNKAIKSVKNKITSLGSMKIEEQKKAMRGGYDIDILPPDLVTFSNETKNVLEALQSQNERLFIIFIGITCYGKTEIELQEKKDTLKALCMKNNCLLRECDHWQEEGYLSSMPIGVNKMYYKRYITTSALAGFMPFTTQELFMGDGSIYYGLNQISNNMILANRKLLQNPNGLILGTPGGGKSFASKREIFFVRLCTKDYIIICDPEGEYKDITRSLKGEVVEISPVSKDYINPLDINLDYADEDSPLSLKVDFVLSMMELICAGRYGLTPQQVSAIDKSVRDIYRRYIEEPVEENVPILEDLYKSLMKQNTEDSTMLADALEIYVYGSLNVFNNRTNVNVENPVLCFDIKQLGKNLKKLGMLIIQDHVWNKVTKNRGTGKSTWYYVDEAHLLLKEKQTAAYSVEIVKRFRKWGGIPTLMTQNIKDFLLSAEVENIFDNCDFIYLLKQAPGDREILAEKLSISKMQTSFIRESKQGWGLIKCGDAMLPFKDEFPKDTQMYKVMTTKPDEVA